MNAEQAIRAWLSEHYPEWPAFWLQRPAGAKRCIVYKRISPRLGLEGLGKATGLHDDVYSITVYYDQPDEALAAADGLANALHGLYHTELTPGFKAQQITFQSGYDQPLTDEAGITVYQCNRDFRLQY